MHFDRLRVGGLGTGGTSSNNTTKLVTEQTGGNRRTGASGLPSTEKNFENPNVLLKPYFAECVF